MAEIYGHKWVSSFGETDMDDTWARGLHSMTPQNLSDGLKACLAREETWPPTLPEFIKLCQPESKPQAHQLYAALAAPKISKDEALAHIAKCRESLK